MNLSVPVMLFLAFHLSNGNIIYIKKTDISSITQYEYWPKGPGGPSKPCTELSLSNGRGACVLESVDKVKEMMENVK